MNQAKGAAGCFILGFENAYGVDPSSPTGTGIILPFIPPFDLGGTESLAAAEEKRADRNPGQPDFGTQDVKGSITVPVDLTNFGFWLKMLLGAPTTAPPTSDTLDNAPAVDKVGDFVGLPISGHTFIAGQIVTINGSTNYDGAHEIVSKTTNEIVIAAVYVAETFAGTETVVSNLYTHIFKSGGLIPSAWVEKGFTDVGQYFKCNGVKVGKLSVEFTGKGGALNAKIDLQGSKELRAAAPFDSAPTSYILTKFQHRQAVIKRGGITVADVKTLTFELDNDLDGDTYCVGAGGVRSSLDEAAVMKIGGKMNAMFADETLYDLAVHGTESSLEVILTNGAYSLTLKMPELFFDRKSQVLVKGGVWVEPDFQAFYENAVEGAAFVATLVNNHASYA